MIKKIFPNELDLFNMSLKRTSVVETEDEVDYKCVVVDKPWGYEYLMFENKSVAVWVLFLKHKAKTSTHCHPKKKTSLLVLDGEVETSSLDSAFLLKSMDGIIIERGVFHSTKSSSLHGSFVMEIETPVKKSDLVRLNDEYGREGLGYESGKAISRNLDNYHYCDFHNESEEVEEVQKLIKDRIIKVCNFTTLEQLHKKLNSDTNKKKILCPLNYKLINKDGHLILDIGEIIETKDLHESFEAISVLQGGFISLIIG